MNTPMRILLASALAAAALGGAPAASAGGDAAEEAAARFREKWTSGVDTMTPEEVAAHRSPLLEPVAASGSMAGLDAVLKVARERAGQIRGWRKRLDDIAEYDRRKAEREKERERAGEAGDAKPGGEDGPQSRAEAERRAFDDRQREEDRAKHPGRIERELPWQDRLAAAAGSLLDALSDGDFKKQGMPLVVDTLGDPLEGWDAWLAAALGASRKERTARAILDAGDAALGEYRKALVARAKPARELDKLTEAINERLQRYFEQQAKQGNYSDRFPQDVVEPYWSQRIPVAIEVERLSGNMSAADLKRRTARAAYGRMLAGASEESRTALLDILDRAALKSRDFESRCFGLLALGPCPGDRAMGVLREAAKDPVPEVVVAALDALGMRGEAEVLDILTAALADERWQVRASAAAGLGASGRAAAVPALIEAMKKAEGRTVDDLQAALVAVTGKEFPAVAAAWEHWWSKAGKDFRGPKDEGGGAAKGGGADGEGPGDGTGGEGSKVSFYGIETRSERLLFILDFSGSMDFAGSETDRNRKKIDILREEMKKTVTGLPDGARFNIIGFAADVRVWRKGPAVRDAKIAKEALEWVDKQPVAGSTNIYDAMEQAFKLMGVGAGKDKSYEPVYDTVFFMTDGKPTSGKATDTALILADVKRWNDGRKIRIHVVGMGGKEKGGPHGGGGGNPRADDLDRKFLEDLAEQNMGEVVFR